MHIRCFEAVLRRKSIYILLHNVLIFHVNGCYNVVSV